MFLSTFFATGASQAIPVFVPVVFCMGSECVSLFGSFGPRSPVAVDIISGLADALRLKAAGCIDSPDFRKLKDQLLRGE